MLGTRTLFIVGAGASSEAGLPVGSDLKDRIASKLNIKFSDGYTQKTGDPNIVRVLKEYTNQLSPPTRDINPLLHAAWKIRDAMPLALSIDNFLEAHQEDKDVNLCGKIGIVHSILDAERASTLFVDDSSADKVLRASDLKHTWYVRLAQILSETVTKSSVQEVFSNVSFVSFNYDRCVEHFLWHALRSYYRLTSDEASQVVAKLTIFHPYGAVGKLPWQDQQAGVPFGGGERPPVLRISRQIRTYAERVEEESTLEAIRIEVSKAETLVFLGFAFHKINMNLLAPNRPTAARRVFATAKKISKSDCNAISEDLLGILQKRTNRIHVELRSDLGCAELFDEYWRSLSA